MNATNIDQVLAQMRSMATQAGGGVAPGAVTAAATETDSDVSFSGLLKQSIDHVNSIQRNSSEMKQAFELGSKDVNLAQVMVATQKSSISFDAMVEVRNKLIDAYKEVMNMPI
jgi:flagellar hook-basal body complex protein FliE